MNRYSVILVAGMLCAGCASSPRHGESPLSRADAQLEAKNYRDAVALYSEFLKTNLQDPQAGRARATQAALDQLLALQSELERVQQGELPRLHRELADRQNEADRLKGEVAKLRTDIERLRNIDLKELQRGAKK
jgi:predicted nuclease with TOPRIM domain